MILVLVVAATFGTANRERGLLASKATAIGGVAFAAGLATSGIVVPGGLALLRANQNPVQPISLATELRMIVGYAALTTAVALLALGLAALVRRAVVAIGLAVALVIAPYLLAVAGLVPWLLMITPAAGFAITQSIPTFAQVEVDPSVLAGYYPLPPMAGLAVTCGYAALALIAATAVRRSGRATGPDRSEAGRRVEVLVPQQHATAGIWGPGPGAGTANCVRPTHSHRTTSVPMAGSVLIIGGIASRTLPSVIHCQGASAGQGASVTVAASSLRPFPRWHHGSGAAADDQLSRRSRRSGRWG